MRIFIAETIQKAGETVELSGWVSGRRDHGKLIFIDLRDSSGSVQVVFAPKDGAHLARAEELRNEWVIRVAGLVKERPKGMRNDAILTGAVEIEATTLEILNEAETPPFPLDTDGLDIDEELRLKYRYVDLRRERLQKNIRMRSRFVQACREYLFKNGFAEIETPLLTKSTPEGSRDFLVPSRLHPGKFYALPQSPQQYKQLLMVGGFERYFQVARALRDEDLRADRGFEHTQIDLEMSFVEQKDVMRAVEGLVIAACETAGAVLKEKMFPVFSYRDALAKFGADKFDLRTPEEKEKGILAFAWVVDFPVFEKDDNGNWTYGHNPFTAPRSEDEEKLMAGKEIGDLVSLQYDLVCNGFEVGGGGIRIHKPEVLRKVFETLGHSKEAIEEQFGHMFSALASGAPPHGGIALGIDRLIMVLTGEKYLREVQAFPMTAGGKTSVMDAPSGVDKKQLKELRLKIIEE
jgi:aspartyl-tRNA synthetase